MSAPVGRNDPCPCGSGRKYKQCCLVATEAASLRWHQLREAEGRLMPELFQEKFRSGERHWIVAALIFALGFAIDLAQGATPTRTFDLTDVAANAGGILIGLVLAWFLLAGWCRRVEQLLVS